MLYSCYFFSISMVFFLKQNQQLFSAILQRLPVLYNCILVGNICWFFYFVDYYFFFFFYVISVTQSVIVIIREFIRSIFLMPGMATRLIGYFDNYTLYQMYLDFHTILDVYMRYKPFLCLH